MAVIAGIVYPDVETAEKAMGTIAGLQQTGALVVQESLWVVKDKDGGYKVHDKPNPVRGKAAGGAVLGLVAGAIFLAPVAGLALGAAAGGLIGKWNKSGAEDDLIAFGKELGKTMEPGSSAVVVFGEAPGRERVIKELGKWGGNFVSTDLSDDRIAEMQRLLDHNAPA